MPGCRAFPSAARLRAFLMVAALCAPVSVVGQEAGQCRFLEGTLSFVSNVVPGAGRISWASRPRIACNDGVRIEADSAVTYSAQSMSHLMGNVRYHDGARELRADEARYFSNVGRLQASGHLFVRDTLQGSTIENGDLVYLRETDFRPQEEMTVTIGPDGVRPRALLRVVPGPDTSAAVGAARQPEARPGAPAVEPDSASVAEPAAAPDTAMVPDTTSVPTAAVLPDTVPPVGDTIAVRVTAAVPDTAMAPDTLVPDTASVPTAAVLPDTVPPEPEAVVPVQRPAPAPPDTVPYDVEANRIFLRGDEYFTASGDVVIDRDSLVAYADSAEYDQVDARMDLVGSARVDGSDYELSGRRVQLAMPGGEMRSVRALHQAQLVGEDLHMRAPSIQIFLDGGEMQRLVAVPLPPPAAAGGARAAEPDSADLARPVAEARDFVLTADSVDVSTPGQMLDRIFAAGHARGESTSRDSLNVESLPPVARRDWMEGDTVIATFVRVALQPGAPTDSAGQDYRLDRLVAHGAARSLYRLVPSDSTARPGIDPPAVSYVTGSKITVVMDEGEVDRMEVEGPTKGWHLEPTSRGAPRDSLAPADSLVPPDTSAVRPDTASVPSLASGGNPVGSGGPGAPRRRGEAVEPARPAPSPTDRMHRRRRSGR